MATGAAAVLSPEQVRGLTAAATDELQALRALSGDSAASYAAARALVEDDAVLPLLMMMQLPQRDPTKDFAPVRREGDPAAAAAVAAADAALLLLAEMHGAAVEAVEEAGWLPTADCMAGVSAYHNAASGEEASGVPPVPGAGAALGVLLQLPMIISPGSLREGEVTWAATVRDRRLLSGGCDWPLRCRDCITVVDVLEEDAEGILSPMRHLVRGPWLGVRCPGHAAGAPAEVDLAAPPGAELETWGGTTLAAAALVAAAPALESAAGSGEGASSASPPAVSFIGLGGGGAAAAFVARHAPGVAVRAADPSPAVVEAAARWLGLAAPGAAPAVDCPGSATALAAAAGGPSRPRLGSRRRGKAGAGGGVAGPVALSALGVWDSAPAAVDGCCCVVVDLPSPAREETLHAVAAHRAALDPGAAIVAACAGLDAVEAAVAAVRDILGSPLRLYEYRVAESIEAEDDSRRAAGGAARYESGHEAAGDLGGTCVLVWAPPGSPAADPAGWLRALGWAEQAAAMPVLQAQRTKAVRVPQLLSATEIEQVHQAVATHRETLGVEVRSPESEAWKVYFLHTARQLDRILPWVRERVYSAASGVDAAEGWGVLGGAAPDNLRVAEYHEQQAPGPGIPDALHYDQDSLVTVDVMLSDPKGGDFAGGHFMTQESDGCGKADYVFEKGDAVVFVSHKYHCVAPVTAGCRRVMVLEFWKGPERGCPHRCETVAGRCPRDPAAWAPPPLPPAAAGGAYAALPFRLGLAVPAEIPGAVRLLWQGCERSTDHGGGPRRQPRPAAAAAPPMAAADAALCDELF
eukprot:TRINITY_DN4390_c0_g1_i1.p1 TRINITY_DN4390_c0_g1~~TRINITY_DN4390_c0_g1_i1.p1  ORF type:complete len:831 (+),score=158.70 TRINITY_DN4390_c0_g1_i1:78-2495(+)